MDIFIQQILNGLVVGSVYALVALGYTMVYGILGLINFAHGDVLMVGALTAYTVVSLLSGTGLPGPVIMLIALGVAIPVCMLLNVSIERIAYRPLRTAPRLAPLITAIGISILLQTGAMMIWGREYKVFPELWSSDPIQIAGAFVTPTKILILVVSAAMMVGLLLLVHRTKLGRAMRATSENPRVASLMGVNPDRVIAATFAIGAALAAVAGVLVAANYNNAHFAMGFMLGLKAFTAAVLGGIGNLAGAMVGGLLLGVVESLGAGYLDVLTDLCYFSGLSSGLAASCEENGGSISLLGSQYQDVIAFVILIICLTLRPSGLLGERIADRA
ncbi:branched-chain amino acid ABC transporter permease [Parvibium lacunae]|uniref:Branched-chain amino acid ABC transporter permease n=1 Tax=Parvibium lacunae TaxID=1888893 RepID=A0A368L6L2_9BURK|nr:branched-chain amino acid ABC transporter permease [Parvibium lacunae]RCS59267.1 branched-chain amino acid ABC transporter permease [Parvibium lacunae]